MIYVFSLQGLSVIKVYRAADVESRGPVLYTGGGETISCASFKAL